MLRGSEYNDNMLVVKEVGPFNDAEPYSNLLNDFNKWSAHPPVSALYAPAFFVAIVSALTVA